MISAKQLADNPYFIVELQINYYVNDSIINK